MPVLGKRPNVFAAPQAKAYRPTMRDQVANVFSRALGDTYQSNELARGLFGSSGLGGGHGNLLGGLGLLDLTPIGAAFALEEAGRQIGGGQPVTGAANVALGMVPIPAVAKGGKAVVRRAARRVAGKAAKAAPAPKPGFTAYHGSPHTFDQFDAAKIGTGEGAQAYGHGLYFAENEGVAKGYRDTLARVKGTAPERARSQMDNFRGDRAAAISWFEKNLEAERGKKFPDTQWIDDNAQVLDALRNGNIADKSGSMYQVRINADPNDFLDWDRPLGAQSPNVQRALAPSYRIEPAGDAHAVIVESRFGDVPGPVYSSRDAADSYVDYAKRGSHPASEVEALVRKAARTQEGASALREAGIPGIRYLDQGSRGAGEGSRNFVVFDPRIIDIMKRYGVAAPVAAAILAGTMQPPKGKEPGA